MKKILNLAMFTTLSIASTAVIAENTGKTYLGIQITEGVFFEGDNELKPMGGVLRVGKYLNDSFAFEGRIGSGTGDFLINSSGSSDSGDLIDHIIKLKSFFGIYGVRHLNFSEKSSVYSVIGVSKVKTRYIDRDVSRTTYPYSDDSDNNVGVGLSLGVGAKLGLTDNAALNIEYMQYLNQSSFVYNTVGLGLNYSF